MGYFRRHKLSDYTTDECREEMEQLEYDVTGCDDVQEIPRIMERWACFRELLARHEKENKSPLDQSKCSECGGWGMPTRCRTCGTTTLGV